MNIRKRAAVVIAAALVTYGCQDQGLAAPNLEVDAPTSFAKMQGWPDSPLHVDQANPPTEDLSWFGCGNPPPAGTSLQQTFIPTANTLPAVSLHLRTLVASAAVTINVRMGAGGPIIGTATSVVFGISIADVQFDFRPPLQLIRGETYAIEWLPLPQTEVTWGGSLTTDTYADGTPYGCTGIPVNTRDQYFVTYRLGRGPNN